MLSGMRAILVQHWNICSTAFAFPDPPADRPYLSCSHELLGVAEDRQRHAVSDVTNVTLSRLKPVITRSHVHYCAIYLKRPHITNILGNSSDQVVYVELVRNSYSLHLH